MRVRFKAVASRLRPIDIVGLVLVLSFVVLAIAAPKMFGAAAEQIDVQAAMSGSSPGHLLGTDELGRDVLARTLVATRASLLLALLATLLAATAGVGLGSLAAVASPRMSRSVANVIAILVAFPPLLLAIFFAVIFGIGSTGSVLAIGVAFTPGFARLTQTLAASLSNRNFVEAARILGKTKWFIVTRHILPNVGEPLLIYGTIHVGIAILALAGLGFLGLGVQPPQYDWGSLLNQGLPLMYLTPSVALGPAFAIALAGLSFNLVGERLSDLLAGRSAGNAPLHDEPSRIRHELAREPNTGAEEGEAGEAGYVLEIDQLEVRYENRRGETTPVRDVSLRLKRSETVGIVGETGSGKSLMARAIAQLIDAPGSIYATRLRFLSEDLVAADAPPVGGRIGFVFQNPGGAFNPAITVGTQMREPAEIHLDLSKNVARERAIAALDSVSISDPARRYRQHQHEFSGGMQQRASIATGLIANPYLLILDEPTTALDVSMQKQILQLIVEAQAKSQASVLLISHDIAVVSQVCDRLLVMYAGFVVEDGEMNTLLERPSHPYTNALLLASPTMQTDKEQPLYAIDGRMPGPDALIDGCYFADRCPRVQERCRVERPPLTSIENGHRAACWYPIDRDGESVSRNIADSSAEGSQS